MTEKPTLPAAGGSAAPRPKRMEAEIRAAAARELAEMVVAQWGNGLNPGVWATALQREIGYSRCGYELAKALERSLLVDPDAELVAILHYASHALDDAHEKAVKAWVAAGGAGIPFSLCQRVVTPYGPGVVVTLHPETAEVLVRLDSHAHERNLDGTGYTGHRLDAEQCSPEQQQEESPCPDRS